ncbi:MAG: 3-deoxy-7-phosphoheptulonate synthase [Bacteroidales bacterium]|nr:3-deoxy-7-phosphoheptulonate synthase [Bacteroidales bacterium]
MDNMHFKRKLPTPAEIKQMYPISESGRLAKEKNDQALKEIFTGESDKMLLIIGPCSADREDAVTDYITRLRELQEKVKDKIVIVPRVYTNKPRTTCIGYKGMLHQPDPTQEADLLKGVIAIRKLHMKTLNETGFSSADEMLYPENHRYLSDLLSYVAIGARSVENQQHRMVASGIDVPVGAKNPTSGNLSVMMNSLKAAQSSHTFLYRGWEVTTDGNPLAHAILRGYADADGISHANYHYEDLLRLCEFYAAAPDLVNPAVIVDTNHANSGKKYLEQIRIAKEILHSASANADIRKMFKGLMIESYLEDGCQKASGREYGKSITDPCLGWEKTERLVLDLADLW